MALLSCITSHPVRAWAARLALAVAAAAGAVHAQVLVQPTNWIRVEPSPTKDKTQEINDALAAVRDNGGGTVFLPAGTYRVSAPLKVESIIDGQGVQHFPMSVRLLGERPIASFAPSGQPETQIVWIGKNPDQAVIEVTHARDTSIENLRVMAAAGRRFRYGFFAHRTDDGSAKLIAPTGFTLRSVGVSPGDGAFTVGVRLNNVHENKAADSNVDNNTIESLYVSGASDDRSCTTGTPADGLNSAGIYIDGSQVQAGYFHDINVENSGTGIFVWEGQLQLFGGWFANNAQPGPGTRQCLADDNQSSFHDRQGRGGGDFVFRTGFSAGHVIQDVESSNSYRFITSFLEDNTPPPDQGLLNDWAGAGGVALAVVGCKVHSTAHPAGEIVFLRGNGGPASFVGCDFGDTGPGAPTLPMKITAEEPSQASVLIAQSRFNHLGDTVPLYQTLKAPFDPVVPLPKYALLSSQGWNGSGYQSLPDSFSDSADRTPLSPLAFRWAVPRNAADRPVPYTAGGAQVVNLALPFKYKRQTYTAHYLPTDPEVFTFDNAPVINAAIQMINGDKIHFPNGKGTIWFPSGFFQVKSSINLRGVSGISLLGVGGRSGAWMSGVEPTKGTYLAWAGPEGGATTLMRIDGAQDILVSGFAFTTAYKPGESGSPKSVDRMIQVSNSSGPSQNVWIDRVSVDWLGGYEGVPPGALGVANSFLVLGDHSPNAGPQRVTLSEVNLAHVAQQGVLLDGKLQDVQFQGLVSRASKRVVRSTSAGGSFAWLGGGGGNNMAEPNNPRLAVYADPLIVELDNVNGPVTMAGLEIQDNFPTRILVTSTRRLPAHPEDPAAGTVTIYGNDHYTPAPFAGDLSTIDFKWAAEAGFYPLLSILGTQLNLMEVGDPPPYDFYELLSTVTARNQSRILALGTFHGTTGSRRPWVTWGRDARVESLGARAYDYTPGLPWFSRLQNWPYLAQP